MKAPLKFSAPVSYADELACENAKHGPTMREIKAELMPKMRNAPVKAWRSRDFCAQLFTHEGHPRLSICRAALSETRSGHFDDGITWDEFQQIESECGFGHTWAVEVFPPDSGVVNVANMRHLWLLTEPPAFAWRDGK